MSVSSLKWYFGAIAVAFLLYCFINFLPLSNSSDRELSAIFVYEIEPLLDSKCLSCHGKDPANIEGGLNLTNRQSMLKGGISGMAAIEPGSSAQSPLMAAIRRTDPDKAMPPKSSEKLSPEEIEYLAKWIDGGAPWPDEEAKKLILDDPKWKSKGKISLAMEGALTEGWSNRNYRLQDLWAYRPISKIQLPPGVQPIDYLVNDQMQQAGLTAAPPASKEVLIRRAYLDLTGLPPAYDLVLDFMNNDDPLAYEALIDRLLDDPGYGEQMARHWMDVVRYADSDGFSNDYVRPNTWRYRDYLIRSFNADKPYDQFVIEQIAGDEIDPGDPEMLIATGYLRMGPWEHTAMSVAKETRQIFLDDVVNSIGETFLSTPLMCAKCHDHKFDPIPSLDYYRIQAIFATTQFADRPAPFLPEENITLLEDEKNRIESWIRSTKEDQERILEKEETAVRNWYANRGEIYQTKKDRRNLPQDKQPPRYYGLTYADLGYRKVLQKRLQTLDAESRRFEPLAFSIYNGPDRILSSGRKFNLPEASGDSLPKTYLLQAGSVFSPSDEVSPGILQVIPALYKYEMGVDNTDLDIRIPVGKDKRRLTLARWLVHPDQAITARSIVNRIWQFHFGKGLADDPNNFGVSAKNPVNAVLLDWLAAYLIKNQWSLKKLHRMIMTSGVYQRSSTPADPVKQELLDPDNQFLSHFNPRRLDAEELRDAMLQMSGELNKMMGGIPVRPEMNLEVALQPRHIMGSIAQAYQPSRTPEERNRRTVYSERIRSLENPFLSVFNQPRTEISCGQRNVSTVTPQVFALFNNEQVRSRALALAMNVIQESDELRDQIAIAINSVWLRAPLEHEITQAFEYIKRMTAYHERTVIPPVERPLIVRRDMFEEMTGEPFSYYEKLDIHEVYEPDLHYSEVSPSERALADFCLILFNSNEFVYVY